MSTEVWFRNPHNYIRELVEAGGKNIAWDRGMLAKRKIDPYKHAVAYYGPTKDWRILLVGGQGTAELDIDHNFDNPKAVYPTWSAQDETLVLLEEMMAYPIGDDADACNDPTVSADERPVANQEHRVVVTDLPEMRTGPGRALMRKIKELQEDYPQCILHIHGLYSWRMNFGLGFGAADVDPRTNAGKGKVTLPSGKEMIAERTVSCPQWVTLVGMKPIDLTREPRNRCIFNIKSALWAGEHFAENIAFKAAGVASVDPNIKNHPPALATHVSSTGNGQGLAVTQPGDKVQCDACSLSNNCKYYRQGSVCSVPGSEPASLANHFGTRDSDMILDGLANLTKLTARRLEKGLAEENLYGELDPEVTKLTNQLFTQGEKLAKLVDPTLRQGPQVQVNVGNQAGIGATTPNQVLGTIVRELESRGFKRHEITPEMVTGLLSEMAGAGNAPRAIEGQVVSRG